MHKNNGACESCLAIITRFPGFDSQLAEWFLSLQKLHPELHTSCAGRNQIDQEAAFSRGASKAHWGESAHSWNCALDLFELKDGKYTLDEDWFRVVIGANLRPFVRWYGLPGSLYKELPHVEIANWRTLAKSGKISLVKG